MVIASSFHKKKPKQITQKATKVNRYFVALAQFLKNHKIQGGQLYQHQISIDIHSHEYFIECLLIMQCVTWSICLVVLIKLFHIPASAPQLM